MARDSAGRRAQRTAILVGLAALLAGVQPARAETPEQQAAALLRQGQALLKKGSYSEALIALMKAQGTFPGAQNQLGIAEAYEGLDNKAEAAELYEKLLSDPNLFGKPQERCKERLEALRAELGRLTIECRVKDAQVQVNNRDVGTTPLPASIYVEPGQVTIVVETPARRVELTPTVAAGEHRTVKVSLREPPPPPTSDLPPPSVARATPLPSRPRPPPRRATAGPDRRDTGSGGGLLGRRWTWIVAGATVVSAAVGMGLGLSATSDYREYKDSETPSSRYQELEHRIDGKATAANAMFAVSGVLAVATAVTFFVEGALARPRSETRTAHRWSLSAGASAGAGQLVLGTSF